MSKPTSTAAHTADVAASFAAAPARRAELASAAVRHLHAFAEEVGLNREEWSAGVALLTAVGQACTETRQEVILLSDVLGLSMLVEMLAEPAEAGLTEPTVLGPYYLPGAPVRAFGASIVDDPATGGEPLVLSGQVRDRAGRPVPGATLDVWEVQPDGRYDVQQDVAKRNLRGLFTADSDGRFDIRAVRPVDYCIPDDGPVGDLLRATGRAPWRAAHIHLLVRAEGFRPLVTHVFDAASPHLHSDAVFGVRDSLVAQMTGGRCRFDLVIAPDERDARA